MTPHYKKKVDKFFKKPCTLRKALLKRRSVSILTMITPQLLFSTVMRVALSNIDLRKGREVLVRQDFDFRVHVQEIGPDLFRRLYRLTILQFCQLRDLLTPHLVRKKKRNNCAGSTPSVEAMLCITLRILAGASYLDVGWPYGVARPTTFAIFDETIVALDKVLPSIIFPSEESDCRFHAEQFRQLRNSHINGIIAALDGIAIQIIQPDLRDTPDPRKYYNRKGFYSICVQAAVGADYKFLFVSARHAGGTHDSTAFQATKLQDLLNSEILPTWVIIAADDAYCNGVYILTPYSGSNLSTVQDTFNYCLSSCRITVEQAFGMLVSRFGIFWSPLRYSLSKDTLVIMVACKLHNFIIDNCDGDEFTSFAAAEQNNVSGTPTVHVQNVLHTEQSVQRSRHRNRENSSQRDYIANRLTVLGHIRPRMRR